MSLSIKASAEVEAAIHEHPLKTVSIYEEGARAHQIGMEQAEETEWSKGVKLTLEDLRAIHSYLFAVAFISAYWHLHNDKQRRDRAAQTASLLVAGTGFGPEEAIRHLIRYEQTWRKSLQAEGIAQRNSTGCVGLLIIILGMLAWTALV